MRLPCPTAATAAIEARRLAHQASRRAVARRRKLPTMLARSIIQFLLLLLPWEARRWLLCRLLGYDIHETATIGLSIIVPYKRLVMRSGARIGHLNLARGMDSI